MVQPAVPAWWYAGGFGKAVIDDPAFVTFGLTVIDVAKFIAANLFSLAPGIKACADGLAVPPGEYLYEKLLHVSPKAPSF